MILTGSPGWAANIGPKGNGVLHCMGRGGHATAVELTREVKEARFETPTDEPLGSEGCEEEIVKEIDTIMATVDVADESPLPEAAA